MSGKRLCAVSIVASSGDGKGKHWLDFISAESREDAEEQGRMRCHAEWPGVTVVGVLVEPVPRAGRDDG